MEKLRTVLADVVDGGPLLTIQPGGNHGDSLIYLGFDKLVDATDIDRVRLDSGRFRYDAPAEFPSTDLVTDVRWLYHQWKYARHRLFGDVAAIYIHGGGNFNDMWNVGIDCYRAAGRYFDCPIVVGPQSCQFERTDPTSIFERIPNETHFFCRERYSYDIMEDATRSCDHVDVYLEDDTALYLEKENLPVRAYEDDYALVAMRMDQDSSEPMIQQDIRAPVKVSDISKMKETFEEWVNTAAQASHVYTDRLHVAILGAILNKPVTWYNTGYHKNQGVYEYSLANEANLDFPLLET